MNNNINFARLIYYYYYYLSILHYIGVDIHLFMHIK